MRRGCIAQLQVRHPLDRRDGAVPGDEKRDFAGERLRPQQYKPALPLAVLSLMSWCLGPTSNVSTLGTSAWTSLERRALVFLEGLSSGLLGDDMEDEDDAQAYVRDRSFKFECLRLRNSKRYGWTRSILATWKTYKHYSRSRRYRRFCILIAKRYDVEQASVSEFASVWEAKVV
ncbi:hypothetical protein SCHPADRAFT_86974 [Schizopora paradoxa]|uniref:Uncharacterized protein n=1 Tax=Schizopora paradoxa TaxID=27342 RepID=A0A0H2S542_9AGAM|nr:hypothetical protein SCHPADRAFT_86974 [Schizopora paradoxa]